MSGNPQISTKKMSISLRQRLITTFVAFTAIPIVVITVFAIFFYVYGIQAWFSDRVSTAIEESQAVARAYLEEHTQAIRADTLAMANDLNRLDTFYYSTGDELEKVLQDQSYVRNLSEAIVFDENGRVLARSGLTFSLEFEEIPTYTMDRADEGEVIVMTGTQDDRVRALVKLDAFGDSYLFAGRLVDPEVLVHLSETAQASQDYQNLRDRYQTFQFVFIFIFIAIAFALIGLAVCLGLILSRQLVAPIKLLMTAAERVRAGDMRTRITRNGNVQEFDYLADSFNRMTMQLEQQRGELVETNRKLDRRRQFTESVLTGVSAGVIGLDANGIITSANASASKLLKKNKENIVSHSIENVFPQSYVFIQNAHKQPDLAITEQIVYTRPDQTDRVFLIKIVVETLENEDVGTVITFDDITDLQSAQRKAAWADVARRIAHEIKNPLTPIQLSAERLKRKYLKEITSSPEIFETCTDTIIHHVDDIERLVTSFSDFARMPEPIKKPYDIQKLISEIVVFQSEAHSAIDFQIHGKTKLPRMVNIDPNLMRQAITNLMQNSVDAVADTEHPTIQIILQNSKKHGFIIAIEDNGSGFPAGKDPDTLTEPYVTYKIKGTGLGLAIVQKVIEDHDGQLTFNRPAWFKPKTKPLSGASVLIVLDSV